MPQLSVNGASLHYLSRGDGPETILFGHGLLFSGDMFAPQIEVLSKTYRCVAFDFRGQGDSEVTRGGYAMDELYGDIVAFIEALGIAPVHYVGLSMGGFIGMRLGARRPDLLRSLTLLDTSADPEPAENVGKYRQLAFVARWLGLGVVAGRVMPIMFGRSFLEDPARATERARWRAQLIANDRVGVQRATLGVLGRPSVADELARIAVPTLVVVGEADAATEPAKSESIHRAIAGSRYVVIPRAGHSSTIEEPAAVTEALATFLHDVTPATA